MFKNQFLVLYFFSAQYLILPSVFLLMYNPIFAQTENKKEEKKEEEKPKRTLKEIMQTGQDKFKQGNYIASVAEFDEALNISPENAEAYQYRGRSKRFTGNYQSALEDYNKAIQRQQNANFYIGRAQTHLKAGNHELSIKDFDMALKINPQTTHAKTIYYNRGVAKQILKDEKGALEDYNQALTLYPDHDKALLNRGYLKYKQGLIRPACLDWVKSKKLGNKKAIQNAEKACQCCM